MTASGTAAQEAAGEAQGDAVVMGEATEAPAPETVVEETASAAVAVEEEPVGQRQGSVVRFGGDYAVLASDWVREVVVVAGSATIAGRVDGDVVVVLGMADLASTADIRGDLTVLGGSLTVAEGGSIRRDMVVIGGGFAGPVNFSPGGQQVVVGPIGLGDGVRAMVPWVARGLLWGRPIVPDLPWVWAAVMVFVGVYLVLGMLFGRPVAASVDLLRRKPLTSFLAGVLVLLLVGPLAFVLAVSVIGLAVVPFLLCALLVAGVFGKIAVARWIGASAVGEDDPDSRVVALRSMAIGLAAMTLVYLVPVLGAVAWTTLGVFGLGAVATVFASGLRRENPAPPAPARQLVPPVPAAAGAGETPEVSEPAGAPPRAATGRGLLAHPRAPFLHRLGAFLLDMVVVGIAAALFEFEGGQFFGILLAYHVVFWGWKGTTLGGIICQLRLVRTTGEPLRFVDGLVRGLASIFSMLVLGLGFLWILKDDERQAWHDKIAGTLVVKVPRDWPLP
jgi:uncharacterized RDD family membrane protein YckC